MEVCLECGKEVPNRRSLATHLQVSHGMKTRDYTVKHFYDDTEPGCQECGKGTKYVSFKFKKYCSEHSLLACSEAGKTGGGSDASIASNLGIPTVDGLGPDGEGMHAENEHLLLPSLVLRTALLTELLLQL